MESSGPLLLPLGNGSAEMRLAPRKQGRNPTGAGLANRQGRENEPLRYSLDSQSARLAAHSPFAATDGCKASRGGLRAAPTRLQHRCRPSRSGLRPAPPARP